VPKASKKVIKQKALERRIANGKEPGFKWVAAANRFFGKSR